MYACIRTYVFYSNNYYNSTRDRSVPNFTSTLFYYLRSESSWNVFVDWLVLYYSYENDNNKNVKRWREKKQDLNRELRVVVVVIVYRENGKMERALYKNDTNKRAPNDGTRRGGCYT
jgi:hypothetical protein